MRDHTTSTKNGYLAMLNLNLDMSENPGGAMDGPMFAGGLSIYKFDSFHLAGGQRACVHTFYLFGSPEPAWLSVCIKKAGEAEAQNCNEIPVHLAGKTSWLYLSTDINTEGTFEEDEEWAVRIQGRGETGAKLYVDDISIASGPCPPPGNCDFEDGLGCAWSQDTHDDLDWLVLQADSPANLGGPNHDHTHSAFDGILQSILRVFHYHLQDILLL